MLKEGERRTLTSGKASVVQAALSVVLAGVKSERDVIPGTRESLEAFVNDGCERMILDLRTVKESPAGIASGVRNLRASHIGQVLVVTAEVSDPRILHEIETLRRPHFFLQYLGSGLLAFVHLLVSVLGLGY